MNGECKTMGVIMLGGSRKSRVKVGRVKSEMEVKGESGTMAVKVYVIKVVSVR